MAGSTGKRYGEEFKLMILEKEKQIKDQTEEIEILKKLYAILMKK